MLIMFKKTQCLATVLTAVMLWLSSLSLASAEMIGTEDIMAQQQSTIERNALLSALDRDEMKQALIQNGIDPVQAKQRVASMTDEEVTQLNGQIATLPAGAGVSTTNLLLIIIILILIL